MALLWSKVAALDRLVKLQEAFVENVERDPVSEKLLEDLKLDYKRCLGSFSRYENPQETEISESLKAQTSELDSQLATTLSTFEEYQKANSERNDLFSSMAQSTEADRLEEFRLRLIQHLSMSIVIKENRQRYQKEQFDRMMIASTDFDLKRHASSMDEWCKHYCMLIEATIQSSYNYMSPKIAANYDDYGDSTVKPLNSTIFYFFFSADRTQRTIAQWLLATARFPNVRLKRAYMRFFA